MDPPLCPSDPSHPHTKAHLDIGGRTITHHYRTAICTAAGQEAFYRAACERQKFMDDQFSSVDFSILSAVSKRHSNHSLFAFKFIHELLPTQQHKSKFDSCSPSCCRCCCPDDQNHFLQCPDAIVHNAIFKGSRSIQQRLIQWGLPFSLVVTIVLCLGEWIEKDEVDIDCIPVEFKSFVRSQSNIGWDLFIRGCVTKEWRKLIVRLNLRKKAAHVQSNAWLIKTLGLMWDHVCEMWDIHNRFVHQHAKELHENDRLERSIERLRDSQAEEMKMDNDACVLLFFGKHTDDELRKFDCACLQN